MVLVEKHCKENTKKIIEAKVCSFFQVLACIDRRKIAIKRRQIYESCKKNSLSNNKVVRKIFGSSEETVNKKHLVFIFIEKKVV